MQRLFDREELEVYRASLAFLAWLEPVARKLPKSLAVVDQFERASTSIPLNIAEGNRKPAPRRELSTGDYDYDYDYDYDQDGRRRRTRNLSALNLTRPWNLATPN